MTDPQRGKAGSDGEGRPPRRFRRAYPLLFFLLALAAATAFLVPWGFDYYTDGFSIHRSYRDAEVRSILWEKPERLEGRINETPETYEPTHASDGLTMVFTRGKARHNADLFAARWNGRSWEDPFPLDGVNTVHDELGPELSRDGRYLYFYSNRPGGVGGYDLWVSRWNGARWSMPRNLGAAVNTEFNEYGPGLSPEGDRIYFSSNRLERELKPEERTAWEATLREDFLTGDYDIFCAEVSHPDADDPSGGLPPEPLFSGTRRVQALNSPWNEGQVSFTPRGDFIYFSSNREGGQGRYDLYRSRILHGAFTEPENLDAPVNSPLDDMDPCLTLEGHGLVFSSNRLADGGQRPFQIYRTVNREVVTVKDWSALHGLLAFLNRIKWPLLALLLGLLALLLLLRYLASQRFRMHASLLEKCLLLSVLVHILLALLTSMWVVTSGYYELAGDRPGETWLAMDNLAAERLSLEIREQVTDMEGARDEEVLERFQDVLTVPAAARPLEAEAQRFEPDDRSMAFQLDDPARREAAPPPPPLEVFSRTAELDPLEMETRPLAFEMPDAAAAEETVEIQTLELKEPGVQQQPLHWSNEPVASHGDPALPGPEPLDAPSPLVTPESEDSAVRLGESLPHPQGLATVHDRPTALPLILLEDPLPRDRTETPELSALSPSAPVRPIETVPERRERQALPAVEPGALSVEAAWSGPDSAVADTDRPAPPVPEERLGRTRATADRDPAGLEIFPVHAETLEQPGPSPGKDLTGSLPGIDRPSGADRSLVLPPLEKSLALEGMERPEPPQQDTLLMAGTPLVKSIAPPQPPEPAETVLEPFSASHGEEEHTSLPPIVMELFEAPMELPWKRDRGEAPEPSPVRPSRRIAKQETADLSVRRAELKREAVPWNDTAPLDRASAVTGVREDPPRLLEPDLEVLDLDPLPLPTRAGELSTPGVKALGQAPRKAAPVTRHLRLLKDPAVLHPVPLPYAPEPLVKGPSPVLEEPRERPRPDLDLPPRSAHPGSLLAFDRYRHDEPRTYHGLEMKSRSVVFCLDLSESMRWNNRIGDARQELLRLLDTLDEYVSFNIVLFSGEARIWNRQGVQPGTEKNIRDAKRFVRNGLISSDGTNTVAALALALADGGVDSIYFLSDGHPTVGMSTDTEEILSWVRRVRGTRDVMIHTIAYVKGDPPSQWRNRVPPKEQLIELMQRLAEENNGDYVLFD